MFPGAAFAGAFESLHTRGDYETLLRTQFAGIPDDWIPNIAEQLAKQQPSPAGDTHPMICQPVS